MTGVFFPVVLSMHAYVGTMAKVHLGGGLTLEVMRLEVCLL